jgi:predicted dehydrogenase
MRKPRIGIVGARGIGKHHAKWFVRAGCEVVALYGTSDASAAQAGALLSDLCGFKGQVYSDWSQFVREAPIDACSVCSPPARHLANALDLLDRGVHLLCEKPLVWNAETGAKASLADARQMVDAARSRGLLLGMNAQYPAALDGWRELHRRILGREPRPEVLRFRMESAARPTRPNQPSQAWIDLGPHPLAFVDAEAPGAIVPGTLVLKEPDGAAEVAFEWQTAGRRLSVHVRCGFRMDGQVCRLLESADLSVQYEGRQIDGEFATVLRAGDQEWFGKDLMRVSVERFIEALETGDEKRLLVPAAAAFRQQEALVTVFHECWEAPSQA